MARSSGGGSRGGGSRSGGSSRSSSSRSGGRGGSNYRTSSTYFPGARKFRYYRGGTAHYVYSDRDLTKIKDVKPRWFLIAFYIPFILVIFGIGGTVFSLPKKPMDTYMASEVSIVDEGDVFSDSEERELKNTLEEFGETTGITTKIVTVTYDQWTDNGPFKNYALARYYNDFDNENGWLIVYSEEQQGAGDWEWEGIQGDNTIKTMDVFIEQFNSQIQSKLVVAQIADPADAFDSAFDKAIDLFKNQKFHINTSELPIWIVMTIFISVHMYFMVFAGTHKKYKNKELEEVFTGYDNSYDNGYGTSSKEQEREQWVECNYCGYQWEDPKNNRCPHCGAMVNINIR